MQNVVVGTLGFGVASVYGGGCSGCNGHAGCIFRDNDDGFGCGETPTAPTVYKDLSYTMGIIKGDTDCDTAAAYWNATVECDGKTYNFAFNQFSDGDDVSVQVPGAYTCSSSFRMETQVTNFEHGYANCLLDLGSNAPSWTSIDAASGQVLSIQDIAHATGHRKGDSLRMITHDGIGKAQSVANLANGTPAYGATGGCSGCSGHAGCIFRDNNGGFGCGETPTAPTVYSDLSYTMGIIKVDTKCDRAAAYWNATVECDGNSYKFAFNQFYDGDNVSVQVPGAYTCASSFRMETQVTNFEHGYTDCLLDLGSNAPSWTSIDAASGKVLSSNDKAKIMTYQKGASQQKMKSQLEGSHSILV